MPPDRVGTRWLLRAEDWLLAGWVALVAPAIVNVQTTSSGPFDAGRPVDGLLGLLAITGAVVCLATRPGGRPQEPGLLGSAAVGPFVGGLLLVVISTSSALALGQAASLALAGVVVAVAVLARIRWPAPPAIVRRALVTPYVLLAGGLFWSLIGAITAGGDLPARIRGVAGADPGSVLPVIGFLLAASAVHFAMLVYAPRQVADREGGPIAWLVRYALFAASIAFGAGWLVVLAG